MISLPRGALGTAGPPFQHTRVIRQVRPGIVARRLRVRVVRGERAGGGGGGAAAGGRGALRPGGAAGGSRGGGEARLHRDLSAAVEEARQKLRRRQVADEHRAEAEVARGQQEEPFFTILTYIIGLLSSRIALAFIVVICTNYHKCFMIS